MCELDAADMKQSKGRTRRYFASVQENLYAPESVHLERLSAGFKDYRLNTNANQRQAHSVVILACRATGVPCHSIRKLVAFKSGA